MSSSLFQLCCFAAGLPFLAILAILIRYFVLRAIWKHKRRKGEKILGFCPSSAALGAALLFLQILVRPSLRHVLVEKREEDKDEDDESDLEGPEKFVDRQLKRIRRGEKTDDLVLRL
jgi:hypothetical protein